MVKVTIRAGLLVLLLSAGSAQAIEPVQVGRYSTLAPVPTAAQTDPLAASVQVTFPARVRTIGDAADYLLSQSGYRLSAQSRAMRLLLEKPLPGTQRSLGPLSLMQALETLGGQPYALKIDPVGRLVAFELRPEFASFLPPEPAPAVPVAASVPAAPGKPQPAQPAVPPAAAGREPAPAAPSSSTTAGPWRPGEDAPAPVVAAEPAPVVAEATPAAVVAAAPVEPAVQRGGKDRRADRGRPGRVVPVAATPVPAVVAVPAVATVPVQVMTRLGPGTLSVALDTWLRDRGWHLVWRSGTDFRIDVPISLAATTPPALLANLSDLYGFPHCVFTQNQTVVVLQAGTDVRQECRP